MRQWNSGSPTDLDRVVTMRTAAGIPRATDAGITRPSYYEPGEDPAGSVDESTATRGLRAERTGTRTLHYALSTARPDVPVFAETSEPERVGGRVRGVRHSLPSTSSRVSEGARDGLEGRQHRASRSGRDRRLDRLQGSSEMSPTCQAARIGESTESSTSASRSNPARLRREAGPGYSGVSDLRCVRAAPSLTRSDRRLRPRRRRVRRESDPVRRRRGRRSANEGHGHGPRRNSQPNLGLVEHRDTRIPDDRSRGLCERPQ